MRFRAKTIAEVDRCLGTRSLEWEKQNGKSSVSHYTRRHGVAHLLRLNELDSALMLANNLRWSLGWFVELHPKDLALWRKTIHASLVLAKRTNSTWFPFANRVWEDSPYLTNCDSKRRTARVLQIAAQSDVSNNDEGTGLSCVRTQVEVYLKTESFSEPFLIGRTKTKTRFGQLVARGVQESFQTQSGIWFSLSHYVCFRRPRELSFAVVEVSEGIALLSPQQAGNEALVLTQTNVLRRVHLKRGTLELDDNELIPMNPVEQMTATGVGWALKSSDQSVQHISFAPCRMNTLIEGRPGRKLECIRLSGDSGGWLEQREGNMAWYWSPDALRPTQVAPDVRWFKQVQSAQWRLHYLEDEGLPDIELIRTSLELTGSGDGHLVFSSQSGNMAGGCEGELFHFRMASGRLRKVRLPLSRIKALALSDDGKSLNVVGEKGPPHEPRTCWIRYDLASAKRLGIETRGYNEGIALSMEANHLRITFLRSEEWMPMFRLGKFLLWDVSSNDPSLIQRSVQDSRGGAGDPVCPKLKLVAEVSSALGLPGQGRFVEVVAQDSYRLGWFTSDFEVILVAYEIGQWKFIDRWSMPHLVESMCFWGEDLVVSTLQNEVSILAVGQSPKRVHQFSWQGQCAAKIDGATGTELMALGSGELVVFEDKPDGEVRHSAGIGVLGHTPDNRLLVSADKAGSIEFWDPKNGMRTMRIDDPREKLRRLKFSEDGRIVFVGCSGLGAPNSWRALSVDTGEFLFEARNERRLQWVLDRKGITLAEREWGPKTRTRTRYSEEANRVDPSSESGLVLRENVAQAGGIEWRCPYNLACAVSLKGNRWAVGDDKGNVWFLTLVGEGQES